MVPYADFNLLRFPDRDQAMAKILDLTMLSDIFPTGFHGAVSAGVGTGVDGLRRRRRARSVSPAPPRATCSGPRWSSSETASPSASPRRRASAARPSTSRRGRIADQIAEIIGVPEVDCAVDCVGFEARGHGAEQRAEVPAAVLNSLMEVTRAGGAIGIPGLVRHRRPGRGRRGGEGG